MHPVTEYKHPWYEYLKTYVPKETNSEVKPTGSTTCGDKPIHRCWGDTTLE